MLSKRILKIKNRHKRSLVSSLVYETFIRVYRKSVPTRKLFQLFFKAKTPKNMIFIVGAYNAGTTILKDVIASHPSIACLPIEGDLLTSELSNMEEGGWHRGLYGNKETINTYRNSVNINGDKLLKDWSPWIKEDHYFLEKSIANSVRIPQLRKAFPGCKFINVIRSPEGVNKGIKKRSKPTDAARENLNSDTYPDSFLNCQWAYIYSLIQIDSKDDDTYNCSYENFIKHPKQSTKALFDFLELDSSSVKSEHDNLYVGGKELYIRPLPENQKIVDYSYLEVLTREIKRLKCD